VKAFRVAECGLCDDLIPQGGELARYLGQYVHAACKAAEVTVTSVTVISGMVTENNLPAYRGRPASSVQLRNVGASRTHLPNGAIRA
jgi:hypothetical protein